MIPYIIHTSILIAASFIFYWVLLRKETFYKLNRFFLITSIILSLTLPLIHIPANLSLHNSEVVKSVPIVKQFAEDLAINTALIDLEKTEAAPIAAKEENVVLTKETEAISISQFVSNLNLSKALWWIYLIGVGIFLINFLIQFIILLFKKSNLESMKDGAFTIYELKDNSAPFSFLKWIFINPGLYDNDTFNQILDHEKIHVKQGHYLDKLIAEIAVIVFWFNPFVWMYRKIISNNLEFLTDQAMIQKGTEKQTYQMSLLKVSVPQHALDLTTNYNESFLSERIKMMNGKKSSARSSWKYLLILPLLALSMSAFNAVSQNSNALQSATIDHEDSEQVDERKATSNNSPKIEQKKTNKEEKVKKPFKPVQNKVADQLVDNKSKIAKTESFSLSATIPTEIKGSNFQMSIKADTVAQANETLVINHAGFELTVDDQGSISRIETNDKIRAKQKSKQKNSFEISSKDNYEDKSKDIQLESGNYTAKIKGSEVCFQMNYRDKSKRYNWSRNECFQIKEISNYSLGNGVSMKVEREAGILYFQGDLYQSRVSKGKFNFESNKTFETYLAKNGYKNISEDEMLLLFLNDTDKSWVEKYNSLDFEKSGEAVAELSCFQVSEDKLDDYSQIFRLTKRHNSKKYKDVVNMAIHGVDLELVESLKKVDKNVSISDAIAAKIHGVTPDYVEYIEESDFDQVDIDQIVAMKIHGVTEEAIKAYSKAGYDTDDPKQLINFAIHGVEPKTMSKMSELGLDFSERDLTNFAIHGVDEAYIKKVQRAGLKSVTAKNLIDFAIHGVSPSDIETLVSLGYKDVSAKELIDCAIHGVNTNEVKRMYDFGYSEMSIKSLVDFKIHGVDADYVIEMQKAGLDNLSPQELVEGKIHGVDADYVQELKDLGIQGINFRKVKDATIHGVSIRFIEKARKKGYNPKYLEDYIKLAIHGI